MTVCVGVDPAAARLDAVALFPDGSYEVHILRMPKTIVERCVAAQRWMERIVKRYLPYGPVHVGIESPLVATHVSTRAGANGALPTARVNGALLAAASRAGANVLDVNNKTWKRTIVGNGNSGKPAVNAWVKLHWPALWVEVKGRQDTCDAACIALEVRRSTKVRRKLRRVK